MIVNKINIESLEHYGETYIANLEEIPSEQMIRTAVINFKGFVPNVSEEEIEEAIKNLETRFQITMDSGAIIRNRDTYTKWYHSSKSERESYYWDRYQKYLLYDKRMPSQVIDKIDEASDEIMANLADPCSTEEFSRKGLVIGAVQSGKTSNYIALMNKAVDSGYKVIILLTGTIEKLRRQTQARVDEGFSGLDSTAQNKQKKTVVVGVGKYKELSATSLTTTDKDFSMQEAIKIDSISGPVIFVLKKNKAILEKLENWLSLHNRDLKTGKIEAPLLLIDDEADNASVNTATENDDPTMINRKIRSILNLFSKSSYVGFTATPFANIFIDPQFKSDVEDDLFPRDFISLLEQPSNYVGPNDMYPEEGQYHYMIRKNDDVERILPLQHKNGTMITKLPQSLEDAIRVFFIANAIRDIRGDYKEHRSMLVHISRFISVQNNVKEHVTFFVNDLKREIKNYILLEEENREAILKLKKVYEKEFSNKQFNNIEKRGVDETWQQVKEYLYRSVASIQVKVVNSGNATKEMNYDDYPDGLRIIAIGGLSLARGLTLEGLMTSYFYRNTKMYDTLMQMGRWFGFRNGYADICRLWTSTDSADWYAHIATATEELRWEIKKMAARDQKPIDFGLKVRSSEDTPLIITAKNKMRSTMPIRLSRSLNGQMVETAIISKNIDDNEANYKAIDDWLKNNKKYSVQDMDRLALKRPTLKNVPKARVLELFSLLEYPIVNDIKGVTDNIQNHDSQVFNNWDVVVASAEKSTSTPVNYGDFSIKPLSLSFDFWGIQENIRLSGSKKRMGSTTYAKGGLFVKEHNKIHENVLEQRESRGKNKAGNLKNASENMYFNTGIERNPLIVIYPIYLKVTDKDTEEYVEELKIKSSTPITGISIGIPDIENVENVIYEYEMNVVMQRETLGMDKCEEEYDENNEDLME